MPAVNILTQSSLQNSPKVKGDMSPKIWGPP